MEGAGHGFEGAAPADLERAYAALMQWFEQHLGSREVEPSRAQFDDQRQQRRRAAYKSHFELPSRSASSAA
jgi:hypothetical protein